MTPTSLLGGVLTGLIDGAIIALVVFLGVRIAARRNHPSVVTHPVAEDGAPAPKAREGELPPSS